MTDKNGDDFIESNVGNARTPIPRKPRPKSTTSDQDLTKSVEAPVTQMDATPEAVEDVATLSTSTEDSSIEERLAAIEAQLEATNKYLGAIDWKMWLYLKAENYID